MNEIEEIREELQDKIMAGMHTPQYSKYSSFLEYFNLGVEMARKEVFEMIQIDLAEKGAKYGYDFCWSKFANHIEKIKQSLEEKKQ